MKFTYFDAHSHVQGSEYDADREKLLASMAAEGIGTTAVGVDKASSEAAVALAGAHEHVFASVGLHPTDTDEPFDGAVFAEMTQNSRAVAIGECGLDYFRADDIATARAKQVPVFEAQIAIAVEHKLPLMIHSRPSKGTMDAYREIIGILQSAKREHGDALTGNVHFFVGGVEEARDFFNLDFTVSYTAVITFARDYDEAIRFAPLERLLSETDSPYVAPAPNRGKRNDPTAVKAVIAALADIRSEAEETVRLATVRNATRVFGLE